MLKSIYYLTTFPEIIESYFSYSIPSKTVEKKLIDFKCINLREYTHDKHKTTDDSPFGGSPGMVMKSEPFISAIEQNNLQETTIILLSPKGSLLTQDLVEELASYNSITFLCGHYEGIDERVSNYANYIISIGDYIIGGGEISSIVITDAMIRLLDKAIGNKNSLINETFRNKRLSSPKYTKPREFRNLKVPEILLSGNHKEINKWHTKESLKWTLLLRKDLLDKEILTNEDKNLLIEIKKEINHLIDSLLNE